MACLWCSTQGKCSCSQPKQLCTSLGNAQARMRLAAEDIVALHEEWEKKRGVGNGNRRKQVFAPRPTLVEMGVGVGKTSEFLPLLAARVPTLVTVKNHQLAEEAEEKLASKGEWAQVHFGRHELKIDEDTGAPLELPTDPGVCPLFVDVANPLGTKSQPVAKVGCAQCPHGLKTMTQRLLAQGRNDQRLGEAVSSFLAMCEKYGQDPNALDECGYLIQMDTEPLAHSLIITPQAYTPSMADHEDVGKEDRLVVQDESADLLQETIVSQKDLLQWRSGLQEIAQKLPAGPVDDPPELDLTKVWQLDAALIALAQELAAMPPGQPEPSPSLLAATQAFVDLAEPFLEGKMMPLAPWEHAQLDWAQFQHTIPLRALKALSWAAEHDGLSVFMGSLACQSPTALAEEIFEGKVHAVVMDATPSPTIRGLVSQVVEAVPGQPLRVQWHSPRIHGRGSLRNPANLDREARSAGRVLAAMRAEARQVGRKVAVLTHKPVAEQLVKLKLATKEEVGWWGADERGHDRWAGRDLLVVGLPILSPTDWEIKWRAHRAIVTAFTSKVLPTWTSKRAEKDYDVEVAPGIVTKSRLKLCATPEIAAWQLQILGDSLTQALGRVRALHNPGCRAVVMGPPVPIGHGGYTDVTVDSEVDPAGALQTASTFQQARKVKALAKITSAAIALLRQGQKPTRRRIEAYLKSLLDISIGTHMFQEWLRHYGDKLSINDLVEVADELRGMLKQLARKGANVAAVLTLMHQHREGEPACKCSLCLAGELVVMTLSGKPEAGRAPPTAA